MDKAGPTGQDYLIRDGWILREVGRIQAHVRGTTETSIYHARVCDVVVPERPTNQYGLYQGDMGTPRTCT